MHRLTYIACCLPASALALQCSGDHWNFQVSWQATYATDHYEVQVGVPGSDDVLGGEFSLSPTINMKYLLPGQTYWFQVRAHHQGQPFGEAWSDYSKKVECGVPKDVLTQSANTSLVVKDEEDSKLITRSTLADTPRRRRTFEVEMIREAHGNKPDGLDNHNAANAEGVSQWLTIQARDGCTIMLFKVHVAHADLSSANHITGDSDHKSYANYASCDAHGGMTSKCGEPGNPPCEYACHPIHQSDCNWLNLKQSDCSEAQKYSKESETHVGMAKQRLNPTWGALGPHGGILYSCPKAGVEKEWHRDKQYRTAKCHKGMSAFDVQHAFNMLPFKKWRTDVSAFASDTPASQVMVV